MTDSIKTLAEEYANTIDHLDSRNPIGVAEDAFIAGYLAAQKKGEELVKAQDEYIKLLSEYEQMNAGFLHVHGVQCPQIMIDRGIILREKISLLKV